MPNNPDSLPLQQVQSWILQHAPRRAQELINQRDGALKLLEFFKSEYPPSVISQKEKNQVWEQCGLIYLFTERPHVALRIFFGLYEQMLLAQQNDGVRIHKGMPLCWISDCFRDLGYFVHAKRYLMLTLAEDALTGDGVIEADATGVYFRLVWQRGLPDSELRRYAREFVQSVSELSEMALFPEAILQKVDDRWLVEIPDPNESSYYIINQSYAKQLLHRLGSGGGQFLEILAQYLMSCMPSCRAVRRVRTHSTDYDLVCSMNGPEVDFRSEFGRYFVCECKDWESAADFTTMAKFCRVLDSTKAKFGILFSKNGISGDRYTQHAAREQLKVFQDRGIVIVVLDISALETIANGSNLT